MLTFTRPSFRVSVKVYARLLIDLMRTPDPITPLSVRRACSPLPPTEPVDARRDSGESDHIELARTATCPPFTQQAAPELIGTPTDDANPLPRTPKAHRFLWQDASGRLSRRREASDVTPSPTSKKARPARLAWFPKHLLALSRSSKENLRGRLSPQPDRAPSPDDEHGPTTASEAHVRDSADSRPSLDGFAGSDNSHEAQQDRPSRIRRQLSSRAPSLANFSRGAPASSSSSCCQQAQAPIGVTNASTMGSAFAAYPRRDSIASFRCRGESTESLSSTLESFEMVGQRFGSQPSSGSLHHLGTSGLAPPFQPRSKPLPGVPTAPRPGTMTLQANHASENARESTKDSCDFKRSVSPHADLSYSLDEFTDSDSEMEDLWSTPGTPLLLTSPPFSRNVTATKTFQHSTASDSSAQRPRPAPLELSRTLMKLNVQMPTSGGTRLETFLANGSDTVAALKQRLALALDDRSMPDEIIFCLRTEEPLSPSSPGLLRGTGALGLVTSPAAGTTMQRWRELGSRSGSPDIAGAVHDAATTLVDAGVRDGTTITMVFRSSEIYDHF